MKRGFQRAAALRQEVETNQCSSGGCWAPGTPHTRPEPQRKQEDPGSGIIGADGALSDLAVVAAVLTRRAQSSVSVRRPEGADAVV